MSIPGKLLIALLSALGAAALAHYVFALGPAGPLFAMSALASIAAVLLSHKPFPGTQVPPPADSAPAPVAGPPKKPRRDDKRQKAPPKRDDSPRRGGSGDGGAREDGEVKWFNSTKGFGFIVRPGGEEIFVHHNSIRGDGRRSLRDGGRVSYRVAQTAKGPQAEDVESLD